MAQKKPGSSQTTVRRIKAKDEAPAKPKPKKVEPAKKESVKKTATPTPSTDPKRSRLKAFSGYFKGAWFELKQVRWPSRSATWSMTAAVLIFTAFFVVLIILLDTGFEWLFEQILR